MNALPEQPARSAAVPVGPPPVPPPGPIAQSVAIGFRSVYIAAALLAVLWLGSNVRQIASDTQAVVLRFGRIVRTQEAGLLIAWPRPIEQVELLPGPERQLSQDVPALPAPTDRSTALIGPSSDNGSPANASAYMTGDSNAVLLAATLIYRISDPVAYALARSHVPAALDRLFRASTVQVSAGRNLNDFLVVVDAQQAAQSGSSAGNAVALRAEVRNSLLQSVNARLQALAADGAPLGIDVERIDMTPSLPPQAKTAFDAVLVAAQAADRGVATAHTDAERRRQGAEQLKDQLISSAQASARELVSAATVNTAVILPIERAATSVTRNSLLLNAYRARVGDIMDRAGGVTLVDPNSGVRFLMPGKPK